MVKSIPLRALFVTLYEILTSANLSDESWTPRRVKRLTSSLRSLEHQSTWRRRMKTMEVLELMTMRNPYTTSHPMLRLKKKNLSFPSLWLSMIRLAILTSSLKGLNQILNGTWELTTGHLTRMWHWVWSLDPRIYLRNSLKASRLSLPTTNWAVWRSLNQKGTRMRSIGMTAQLFRTKFTASPPRVLHVDTSLRLSCSRSTFLTSK